MPLTMKVPCLQSNAVPQQRSTRRRHTLQLHHRGDCGGTPAGWQNFLAIKRSSELKPRVDILIIWLPLHPEYFEVDPGGYWTIVQKYTLCNT